MVLRVPYLMMEDTFKEIRLSIRTHIKGFHFEVGEAYTTTIYGLDIDKEK